MTHDWKPGDRAMVIVDRVIPHGFKGMVPLKTKNGVTAGVWIEALYPLPMLDPITDLERAVVEAAMVWLDDATLDDVIFDTDYDDCVDLVETAVALRAARTPPAPVDPMAALRNAWEAPRGMMWAEGVHAALVAAEEAWKEIKK